MSTSQAWVDRTRSYLTAGHVGERNKLAADYTAGSGTLSFSYDLGGITKGQRISIGLNTFYVWDVNTTAKTATVQGGYEGTTDVNAASGSIVLVRPRVTDNDIFVALNEELAALSSPQNGLFQVKTIDVTFNPVIQGYNISATDILSIYQVRAQTPGPAKDWPIIPAPDVRLDRSQLTSDFAGGTALQLMVGGYSGYDVRVLYRAPYSQLADLTTVTSTTGISTEASSLPPLGAAIILMAGREIARNDTTTQPDTRRATEVPSGAVFNSYRGLLIKRQELIAAEAARLSAQYPFRQW